MKQTAFLTRLLVFLFIISGYSAFAATKTEVKELVCEYQVKRRYGKECRRGMLKKHQGVRERQSSQSVNERCQNPFIIAEQEKTG